MFGLPSTPGLYLGCLFFLEGEYNGGMTTYTDPSSTVTLPRATYDQLIDLWADNVVAEYKQDRARGTVISGGSLDDLD